MADENIAAAPEAADEFEAAFSEFAESRSDDAVPVAEAEEQTPQAEEPAAEVPEAKADEQPGAAPVAEEKPAVDWEHRFKSEVGRQAAYQRQIAELKEQLEAAKKQPSEPEGSGKQAQTEHMKRLMSDFPEIAEAMQAEMEARLASLREEFSRDVAPVKQAEQQRYVEREEQSVIGAYPDYKEMVNTTEFFDWFSRQPDAVKALARSNNAGDAIAMLDYYTGGKRQSAGASAVQEIKEKRQQALQRNVSVRNSAPPPVGDGPDDFESAFAFYAKQAEKRRA